MVTASFSVDSDAKDDIARWAAEDRKSQSDIFRDMYRSYRFGRALDAIQAEGRLIMLRLGLETDDDIVDYAEGRGKFAKQNGRTAA